MSKKSHFRGSFHKKYGKRAQRLFKSSSQQHYHIHWSLARKLSSKKSLLLTCQILGLLLNTLAADEKYPVLNRDNLTIPIHIQLSQKRITFSQFLAPILKSSLNFKHLEKQMTLTAFVFTKLQTPKTYSDKCLKSRGSEDPLTSNMVNVQKHSCNLRHTAFIIFLDNFQGNNWVGKTLSSWYAKSFDCLLTHSMPLISILFLIMTI